MAGSCVAAIMGVWLGLAQWHLDLGDSTEARAELYRPVAEATPGSSAGLRVELVARMHCKFHAEDESIRPYTG